MESRGASRLDCVSPRRAAPPNSIAYLCFRAAALLVRRIAACLAEQPVSARTLLSAIVEAGCSGKRAAATRDQQPRRLALLSGRCGPWPKAERVLPPERRARGYRDRRRAIRADCRGCFPVASGRSHGLRQTAWNAPQQRP